MREGDPHHNSKLAGTYWVPWWGLGVQDLGQVQPASSPSSLPAPLHEGADALQGPCWTLALSHLLCLLSELAACRSSQSCPLAKPYLETWRCQTWTTGKGYGVRWDGGLQEAEGPAPAHKCCSSLPASPCSRSNSCWLLRVLLAALTFPDGDLLFDPHMPSCSSALSPGSPCVLPFLPLSPPPSLCPTLAWMQ